MWITLFLFSLEAQAADFLDAGFAAELCTAWNQSTLPGLLGRGGSGWVDSAGSQGHQIMVMSRRDCQGWKKVQLVIDADAEGAARCTSGGAWSGDTLQWKFEPTTAQWADFTDGFGVMDMPGIMNGFTGPYPTAAANIDSFEVFFAVTGDLALRTGASWRCTGADPAKVDKALSKIDKDDTREILGR